MAKSYKQQKTKEKLSKDILEKLSKKRRQFNKELADAYINEENEEEEHEFNFFKE